MISSSKTPASPHAPAGSVRLMSDRTQKQALLAYVRRHHFITRWHAAVKLGVMNLWARISELEDDGHRFDRRTAKLRGGKRVLQYWLVEGRR
jgi:hypothetical protein